MSIRIKIDDSIFPTLKEAADFLEISTSTASYLLAKKPLCKIKGFRVERLIPYKSRVKIKCLTTDTVFNTIESAATKNGISRAYLSKLLKDSRMCNCKGLNFIKLNEKPELTRNVKGDRKKMANKRKKIMIEDVKIVDAKSTLTDLIKECLDRNDYKTSIILIEVLQKL